MNLELIQKIEKKHLLIRYFFLTIFLFLSAIIFNLFLRTNNITTGGINGVAIIFETIFNFEPALTIFFFSLALLALSFLFLSKEQTIGNLATTFLYPLFVKITSGIDNVIPIANNNMIVICLYAGILGGLSSGIIYKMGFSNGGFSIINQLLYKYFKLEISKSTFFLNAIIVVIGGFIFGYEMVLYAIIILYINSLMISRVMLGISNHKAIYIVTNQEKEIKKCLQELNLSFTIFESEGVHDEKQKNVFFTAVPTHDYFRLTEKLKKIDKKIFFVVTDSYQLHKKVLNKKEIK